MREQAIEAGEVLFREGEPSDSVYLILDGEVEILRRQDGRAVRPEQVRTIWIGVF